MKKGQTGLMILTIIGVIAFVLFMMWLMNHNFKAEANYANKLCKANNLGKMIEYKITPPNENNPGNYYILCKKGRTKTSLNIKYEEGEPWT